MRDWFRALDADATTWEVNLMGVNVGATADPVTGTDARISTSVEPGLPNLCDIEYTDRVAGGRVGPTALH